MAGRGVTEIITHNKDRSKTNLIKISKKGHYSLTWVYSKDLDDLTESSFAEKVRNKLCDFHECIKAGMELGRIDIRRIRAFKVNNNLVWLGKSPCNWNQYNPEKCLYKFKNNNIHDFFCAFESKNNILTLLTVPAKTPVELEISGNESKSYYNNYMKKSRIPLIFRLNYHKKENSKYEFEPINLI